MSSDLLEEFGDFKKPSSQQTSTQIQDHYDDDNDDDDFGEFEEATSTDPNLQPNLKPIDPEDESHSHSLSVRNGRSDEWSRPDDVTLLEDAYHGNDWGWQDHSSQNTKDTRQNNFEEPTVLFDAERETPAKKLVVPRVDRVRKKIAPPVTDEDDDFDAWEPTNATQEEASPPVLVPQPKSAPAVVKRPEPAQILSQGLGAPPSNVPPPSTFLALGMVIVKSLRNDVKGEKEDPQLALLVLRSLGRVLAGRKVRWKRDQILSQSMRIGQAGRQGGMKLTSLDRSSSRQEDQEAAELILLWHQCSGALKAELGSRGLSDTPEIGNSMPVRTGTAGEGAIVAPKPCFLCGLKREERVHKLDFTVEDSFGEWWVEHWGHRDCVNFWQRFKESLPQR